MEYDPLFISDNGIKQVLLLRWPTAKQVNPAIEAWIAFYANYVHIFESWELALTDLTIYKGSIYLTSDYIPWAKLYFNISDFKNAPISPNFIFPEASFPLSYT